MAQGELEGATDVVSRHVLLSVMTALRCSGHLHANRNGEARREFEVLQELLDQLNSIVSSTPGTSETTLRRVHALRDRAKELGESFRLLDGPSSAGTSPLRKTLSGSFTATGILKPR
jgi:hypothetical protein